jgi:D-sedoheptulose 7-phosphate isomerase
MIAPIAQILRRSATQLRAALDALGPLAAPLKQLADSLMRSWKSGGKALIAGNGGSAADAMHFAEELVVRFAANRRALGAIALCDPTVLTCAANDLGYDRVFERQVEALGRPGDVLIVLSTSGNSPNLLRAVAAGRKRRLKTAAFLGKGGGKLRGRCDIELIVNSDHTARIQEIHKLLFHSLCEWVDGQAQTSEGKGQGRRGR